MILSKNQTNQNIKMVRSTKVKKEKGTINQRTNKVINNNNNNKRNNKNNITKNPLEINLTGYFFAIFCNVQ